MEDRDEGSNISRRTWYQNQRGEPSETKAHDRNWGKPILWHIMKYYSEFGFHEFIICLGYKQYVVKEFFADYFLHTSDVTFDLANNKMEVHNNYSEPWKVTLVDTGLNTMTGGRVKRIQPFVGYEPFMLTYGDGVSTVDLDEQLPSQQSTSDR